MSDKSLHTPPVTGTDPGSWQVTILRLPKRFSRGAAFGFCGGQAVGRAETPRARSLGCWWPSGEPELLTLDSHEEVATGSAGGEMIPGQWHNRKTGAMGAVIWGLHGGRLVGTDLHDRSYEKTWATAVGGDAAVGAGSLPRQCKAGLLWRKGGKPTVVAGAGDVLLLATDGTRLGGSINGRATLWPSATAAPIDLTPEGLTFSEVQALEGDLQIGAAWKDMCSRAGLWRGTAASFCDLTPKGFELGRAFGGTRRGPHLRPGEPLRGKPPWHAARVPHRAGHASRALDRTASN